MSIGSSSSSIGSIHSERSCSSVGPHLPVRFATFAAYGDLATGVLAMLALWAIRMRPLFWLFTVAFNVVVGYCHGVTFNLPARSGELGAT